MSNCKKCGSAMVLWTAKGARGHLNKFYGCSDFPNCWKKTSNLPALTLLKKKVNEIWKLEKNEKKKLRNRYSELMRGHSEYAAAEEQEIILTPKQEECMIRMKKEMSEIDNAIKEAGESQMKILKEIKIIIGV